MKIKPRAGAFRFTLGDRGEIIAADYLAAQGYKIIGQKIRASFGELDLVVQKNDTLVFVEVKTRAGTGFGAPEESVDAAKQKKLTQLAAWYLQQHSPAKTKARFDVISIYYDGRQEPQVRHFENAFEAASEFNR